MKTIYKYNIPIQDATKINMPEGAKILTVKLSLDKVGAYVWALVDTEKEIEERVFCIIGTGNPIINANSLIYIGTFCQYLFVWHVFEKKEKTCDVCKLPVGLKNYYRHRKDGVVCPQCKKLMDGVLKEPCE